MSLRLDPEDLGVFSYRISKMWNMAQPADVLKLNESGHIWSGASLNQALVRQIQEVVSADPKSTKHENQIKQKQLFWDLAEIMPSFQKTGLPRCWKELITAMRGPKPTNPIFRNFFKVHEKVDVKNETTWKLWEFSVAPPSHRDDQSSREEAPPRPKRPIVVEREV